MSGSVKFCDLPDEIILMIFQYVKEVDLISLSEVCTRFNGVYRDSEWKLVRKVNFDKAYSLNTSTFKAFFKPKIRCNLIRQLNISNCYWIKEVDICNALKKCHQLNSLFAVGTKFDIDSLSTVHGQLPQLRRLSLPICHGDGVTLAKNTVNIDYANLALLEALYLEVNSFFTTTVKELIYWLGHCRGLHELWVVGNSCTWDCWEYLHEDLPEIDLPQLNTLVLDVSDRTLDYLWKSLKSSIIDNKWKKIWISDKNTSTYTDKMPTYIKLSPTDCTAISLSEYLKVDEETLNSIYPCVTYIMTNGSHEVNSGFVTPARFPNLKHFFCATPMTTELHNCIRDFSNLESLQVMRLPATHYASPSFFLNLSFLNNLTSLSLYVDRQFQIKNEILLETLGAVSSFVTSCPNVKQFTLSENKRFKHIRPSGWSSLVPVYARWTQITSLTLDDVYMPDGSFFTTLSDSSPNVQSLTLVNIGVSTHSTFSVQLAAAITTWKQLKHFSLVQQNMTCVGTLLDALALCPHLEFLSLVFMTVNVTANEVSKYLVAIVAQAKLLTLFYVTIVAIPAVWISRIKAQLKTYRVARPSLVVFIANRKDITIKKEFQEIPTIHARHLCYCSSWGKHDRDLRPPFYSQQ